MNFNQDLEEFSPITLTNLGNQIIKLRKLKGYTRKELAAFLTIKPAHLGLIERGKTIPSFTILYKLANEFKVPFAYFSDVKRPKDYVVSRFDKGLIDKEDKEFIMSVFFKDDLDKPFIEASNLLMNTSKSLTKIVALGEDDDSVMRSIAQAEIAIDILKSRPNFRYDFYADFYAKEFQDFKSKVHFKEDDLNEIRERFAEANKEVPADTTCPNRTDEYEF